ncbi:BREX-3 system phosphatase PglZ [Desulfofundulus thermobenzoicus]|uniref:BREX-3 system phosphatase PglZ n=1 Tax=Desulfofundulus thermobenzoicus TaxID=29376 RepID=A0A6N7IQF3_9FIRM|nr:BREX-3 system phosphatase PglZ [Desulfofundulus thermobenzoicus]MQL52296.1 BREX-3 system phosphatase PglZ [Desulfofundulus thermobenzoicus]
MTSWRDHILQEFTPGVARLTLVADPDGLLLEEGILEGIRGRGFEVIPFEDPVSFRYTYESGFRSRWDRGEETDLVVLLRSGEGDLDSLPYDLLQVGRKLYFSLGEIFPHLSYPVVAALDRGDMDALYEAQEKYAPGQLGDNATKEFILRHVFEITPEFIKEPKDLLRVLLRRHYRGQRVPAVIDERFVQLLRQNDAFHCWPLETIVPDRENFFAFLQERWPLFLDRLAGEGLARARETGEPYGLAFAGPLDLPFDDGDVRVYLDNLFLERLLQPLPHKAAGALSGTWAGIGVRTDPAGDRLRRLAGLMKNLRSSIPAGNARHRDWLRFARGWAELTALIHGLGEVNDSAGTGENRDFRELQSQVDAAFTAWLAGRYAGLGNLPPAPPVMLHHVPRYLARYLEENPQGKIALLVLDGLSLDQWITLREALTLRRHDLRFRENTVFAWIPTITAVCRQAVFAGRPPVLYPDSIHTTDREPALWAQFWVDQGLTQNNVVYARGLGDGTLQNVMDLLSKPGVRVAGLVVDKVDKIMHGMELGTAGMHNQVRQWARQPYLTDLLEFLLERGFQVFLTSDHGNIEAGGCGRPAEGAVADLRGERVRVFADALLRDQVHGRFPEALKWPPVGLPENYLPLIAPARQAFVRRGERVVCHGGLSIEEVIVPLVQIEKLPAGSTCVPVNTAGTPAAGGRGME